MPAWSAMRLPSALSAAAALFQAVARLMRHQPMSATAKPQSGDNVIAW